MKKILIVEDEDAIAQVLILYLENEGFTVLHLSKGSEVLTTIQNNQPDLVILDLMLPDISGIEVCKQIRKRLSLPIIMLTARSTEDDKVLGLESGADDYVCKPFGPKELMARVNACLRRINATAFMPVKILSIADIEINILNRELLVRNKKVKLTNAEFDLLLLLATQPGRAYSRQELLDKVLPDSLESSDRTIDTHINNLRRKIEKKSAKHSLIETVFGYGYRFTASPKNKLENSNLAK